MVLQQHIDLVRQREYVEEQILHEQAQKRLQERMQAYDRATKDVLTQRHQTDAIDTPTNDETCLALEIVEESGARRNVNSSMFGCARSSSMISKQHVFLRSARTASTLASCTETGMGRMARYFPTSAAGHCRARLCPPCWPRISNPVEAEPVEKMP